MVRILVLAVVLAGCVQSSVVHCADGRTCPAGTVCAEPMLCAVPVQLTVCDGQPEDSPCSFPGGAGVCIGGVCLPGGCGNGIRETGEACDDANRVSGDGCSSDCQSNELCGDLEPNPFLGEECDDGNRVDHDGCSSSCRAEVATWSRHEPGPPPIRRGAAIAYDSVRKRVVLFGGTGPANQLLDDTWEWDGASWARATPLSSPSARFGAAMAFDPTTGRIVLFGGLSSGALADTWEYLGSTWRKVVTPTPPLARYGHALAYDGVRKRVVLVGGTNVIEHFDHAYAWSGSDWEPLPPLPRPRADHAMAFDPVRGQLVVFSGRESTTMGAIDDAWALDATGWSPLPASGAPRGGAAAAFDPINARVLVFGGTPDGVTSNAVSTLSAWNGATWSTVGVASPPSPRTATVAAYDLAARRLLVFGGYLSDFSYDNTTFTLGASWQVHAPTPVVEATELGAAWDVDRGVGLLAGAGTSNLRLFRWSGGLSEVAATGPSSRFRTTMAWTRDTTLIAGGFIPGVGAIQPVDTWSFATSWLMRGTGSPFPRTGSPLAPGPTGVVLFGGRAGGATLADTWRWTGTAWVDTGANGPPARTDHAMAYDPIRQRTVLYGGIDAGTTQPSAATWEWDGATWTEVVASTPAPARARHHLVYDPQRRRVLSFSMDAGIAEILEQDGTTWSLVQPSNAGPMSANRGYAAFYDPLQHALIVASSMSGTPTEIWRLRYQSVAPDERCGSALDADQDGLVGCDDPDCWPVCSPHCAPGTIEAGTCDTSLPRCGDGTCGAVEDCAICPVDCGPCAPVCGDGICDAASETPTVCPGDC